jgi:cell division protein FtsB
MDKEQENQQGDLEERISEAEMEAQLANSQEEQEKTPFEDVPAESPPADSPPEKKELSRARKIWRRVLIWLVVLAIFFAGGFFLDTYLRYSPAQDQIAVLKADLEDKTAEITSLQEEIDRLNQFEEQNASLLDQIDQLEIHLNLLSGRTAVAEASLAVEQDRISDARLALDTLGKSLESLRGSLNADQTEVVDSMRQRYELVLNEMGNEGYSVLTDLDLLANRLIALENNLFANP